MAGRPTKPDVSAAANSIATNWFRLESSGLLFQTMFVAYPNPAPLPEKYKLISALVGSDDLRFLLSENGDTFFAETLPVGLEHIESDFCRFTALGPAAPLPIDRLFRLAMIRVSCLEPARIRFPLESDPNRFELLLSAPDEHLGQFVAQLQLHPIDNGWAVSLLTREEQTLFSMSNGGDLDHLKALIGRGRGVICNHYGKSRRYRVIGATQSSAHSQTISIDGKVQTVFHYFQSLIPGFKDWSITMRHPGAPLVFDAKQRYLPIELCFIRLPARPGAPAPKNQLNAILGLVGISVGAQIKAKARVLPAIVPRANPTSPLQVFVFSFADEGEVEFGFLSKLSKNLKVPLPPPVRLSSGSWEPELREGLNRVQSAVDVFLVLFSHRPPHGIYDELKFIFDTKVRVPSQVVVLANQTGEAKMANLVGQMMKKAGENRPSSSSSSISTSVVGFWTELVLGTNVQLLGLTMSTDHGLEQFVSQVRAVPTGVVKSDMLEEAVYELLLSFFATTNCFPTRLVSFRRSLPSKHQFSSVTNELRAFTSAIARINREIRTGINPKLEGVVKPTNPGLTLVHCDRHTEVRMDAHPFVPPTVAVESDITAPCSMNFFLTGFYPIHFSVQHDSNNFTLSEMVNFAHQLGTPPTPLQTAKKLVKRAALYISQSETGNRRFSLNELCEYLNQKLFSPDANIVGRMLYV